MKKHFNISISPVAQSVEQDPVKIKVRGSSPLGGASWHLIYPKYYIKYMGFLNSIIDRLSTKITVNTQPEDQQVINLLKPYSYRGKTEDNDSINSIVTEFYNSFGIPPKYVSVYKFIFNNISLYFVDSKTVTRKELLNVRQNMIFPDFYHLVNSVPKF